MVQPGQSSRARTLMIRPRLNPCSPPGRPQPQIRSSIIEGSRAGTFSSTRPTTWAARSSGRTSTRWPLKARPMGERPAATMTASGIARSSWNPAGRRPGDPHRSRFGSHRTAPEPVYALGRAAPGPRPRPRRPWSARATWTALRFRGILGGGERVSRRGDRPGAPVRVGERAARGGDDPGRVPSALLGGGVRASPSPGSGADGRSAPRRARDLRLVGRGAHAAGRCLLALELRGHSGELPPLPHERGTGALRADPQPRPPGPAAVDRSGRARRGRRHLERRRRPGRGAAAGARPAIRGAGRPGPLSGTRAHGGDLARLGLPRRHPRVPLAPRDQERGGAGMAAARCRLHRRRPPGPGAQGPARPARVRADGGDPVRVSVRAGRGPGRLPRLHLDARTGPLRPRPVPILAPGGRGRPLLHRAEHRLRRLRWPVAAHLHLRPAVGPGRPHARAGAGAIRGRARGATAGSNRRGDPGDRRPRRTALVRHGGRSPPRLGHRRAAPGAPQPLATVGDDGELVDLRREPDRGRAAERGHARRATGGAGRRPLRRDRGRGTPPPLVSPGTHRLRVAGRPASMEPHRGRARRPEDDRIAALPPPPPGARLTLSGGGSWSEWSGRRSRPHPPRPSSILPGHTRRMGDDHAAGLAGPAAEDLLHRFLDGRPEATARAYAADLSDLARFLDTPLPQALAILLGDPTAAARLALDYALHLRSRSLAPATVARRLATLRALVGQARELEVVDWSLRLPSPEEVEAARERPREPATPYLFPRHPDEVDRLDLQHFALREALGANFLAPVESPVRVLDVGTGTGQWGFEMAHRFPTALVVGFDLVRGKPNPPPGYRHVRGNLLQGLPFRDDVFDFVHQRFLIWGIPVAAWPGAVAELVRVTRPGGWVELTEIPTELRQAGPSTERLFALFLQMAGSQGLDTEGIVFRSLDDYLRRAGLEEVRRRELSLPVGEWGGQVGSFMATDFRAAGMRICEALRARSSATADEAEELLRRSLEEWERHHTVWPVAIAHGRKPI